MSEPTYADIPSDAKVKALRATLNAIFAQVFAELDLRTRDWGSVASQAALATLTDADPGDTASLADGSFYRLGAAPATTVTNWKKLAQITDVGSVDLSGLVHLAGAETVTGAKNFTGGLTINGTDVPTLIATALQTFNITGQYIGSAASFAALPTTDATGKPASNGDWAALTSATVGSGTSNNPQYPAGAYVFNGTSFSFAFSFGSLAVSGLLPANNLSDVNNATTARANLGLGTAATQPAAAFDAAGAATTAQATAQAYTDAVRAGLLVNGKLDQALAPPRPQIGRYSLPYAPTFTKAFTSSPMLTAASGSYSTIYWPWVVRVAGLIGTPLDNFYLWYSTDHASGGGTSGGIGLMTGPTPLGPWTNRGQVFIDSSGGSQTETPSVLWVPEQSKFYMYYQQQGALGAVGTQSTCLATSPDGVTWTRYGIVLDIPNLIQQPGDGHTGYLLPFRVGSNFVGFHLRGGAAYPHSAISYSADGKKWLTDSRPMMNSSDVLNDINYRLSNPVLFNWRSQTWGAFIKSTYSSFGSATGLNDIVVAPMAPNLKWTVGAPVKIAALTETWEVSQHVRSLNAYSDPNGNLYLYYQVDQNIGVLIGGDS